MEIFYIAGGIVLGGVALGVILRIANEIAFKVEMRKRENWR